MNIIENKTFDEERALYGLRDTTVSKCTFAGPADGESAFKEAKDIVVKDCDFRLRYPLWHVANMELSNSMFAETCRAALWYAKDCKFTDNKIDGVKFLRECDNITFKNCEISSQEFGWKCRDIKLVDTSVQSEYIFLDSSNIKLDNVKMKAKYSFQYVHDMVIENSYLDTKDAFWHTKNVTVRNSTIKGEYLAWYSDGLTLENCKIVGTQPLCYCTNLKLINCTMESCDLSFEYSDVQATINGHVDSIKNPKSGEIKVDSIGEILMTDDVVYPCNGKVIITG